LFSDAIFKPFAKVVTSVVGGAVGATYSGSAASPGKGSDRGVVILGAPPKSFERKPPEAGSEDSAGTALRAPAVVEMTRMLAVRGLKKLLWSPNILATANLVPLVRTGEILSWRSNYNNFVCNGISFTG
jgi:hypothetical protein